MGAQNNHLNVTVLLSTLIFIFVFNKKTKCKLITPSYLEAWCLSIFLHPFVIDHIYCYYFRLMTYSIGRKNHCEAKG